MDFLKQASIDTTGWNLSSIECLRDLDRLYEALADKPERMTLAMVQAQLVHLEKLLKFQRNPKNGY